MTRAPVLLLLALLLAGCGGGADPEGASSCAPAPEASAHASTQARPVPKNDARELDALTPAEAALVARLHAAEKGQPPVAVAPAARAPKPSPSCAAHEPAAGGH